MTNSDYIYAQPIVRIGSKKVGLAKSGFLAIGEMLENSTYGDTINFIFDTICMAFSEETISAPKYHVVFQIGDSGEKLIIFGIVCRLSNLVSCEEIEAPETHIQDTEAITDIICLDPKSTAVFLGCVFPARDMPSGMTLTEFPEEIYFYQEYINRYLLPAIKDGLLYTDNINSEIVSDSMKIRLVKRQKEHQISFTTSFRDVIAILTRESSNYISGIVSGKSSQIIRYDLSTLFPYIYRADPLPYSDTPKRFGEMESTNLEMKLTKEEYDAFMKMMERFQEEEEDTGYDHQIQLLHNSILRIESGIRKISQIIKTSYDHQKYIGILLCWMLGLLLGILIVCIVAIFLLGLTA